jgi:hypothetical protein
MITNAVGSMWCAYIFAAIAIYGLPAALKPGGEGIVSWVAQTFLQLVLLSIILVGGNTQAQASDARAAKTFEDTEVIVDRLDSHTEGGIAEILAAVDALSARVDDLAQPPGAKSLEPLSHSRWMATPATLDYTQLGMNGHPRLL